MPEKIENAVVSKYFVVTAVERDRNAKNVFADQKCVFTTVVQTFDLFVLVTVLS